MKVTLSYPFIVTSGNTGDIDQTQVQSLIISKSNFAENCGKLVKNAHSEYKNRIVI